MSVFGRDGGPASEAALKRPYGIEVAGDTLYISDTGNSVIRSVKLRVALALCFAACGAGGTPLLPEDYAATFTEVRDCRRSADHDLRFIRILVDPDAVTPYTERISPFPPGAFLVKEEFDFANDACAGPLLEWTVMQRRTDATNLGWIWQRLGADRVVISDDEDRCIGCHSDCGKPPDGYDSTCAVP